MFWLYVLKSVAVCCVIYLTFVLASLRRLGRKLARNERRHSKTDLSAHRFHARMAFGVPVLILALVEVSKMFFPDHHYPPLLSHIHRYGFAIPFFVLVIVANFWITGQRYPRIHKWIVYPCLTLGVITAILGIVLLMSGR